MFNGWFQWFILFWIFLLPTLLGIGGFFMFRKFLKSLPKKRREIRFRLGNLLCRKNKRFMGSRNPFPSRRTSITGSQTFS